jgi:hypothetical protein
LPKPAGAERSVRVLSAPRLRSSSSRRRRTVRCGSRGGRSLVSITASGTVPSSSIWPDTGRRPEPPLDPSSQPAATPAASRVLPTAPACTPADPGTTSVRTSNSRRRCASSSTRTRASSTRWRACPAALAAASDALTTLVRSSCRSDECRKTKLVEVLHASVPAPAHHQVDRRRHDPVELDRPPGPHRTLRDLALGGPRQPTLDRGASRRIAIIRGSGCRAPAEPRNSLRTDPFREACPNLRYRQTLDAPHATSATSAESVKDAQAPLMWPAWSLEHAAMARYPVQLLPLLVFESLWKLIWLAAVGIPHLMAGDMTAQNEECFLQRFVGRDYSRRHPLGLRLEALCQGTGSAVALNSSGTPSRHMVAFQSRERQARSISLCCQGAGDP